MSEPTDEDFSRPQFRDERLMSEIATLTNTLESLALVVEAGEAGSSADSNAVSERKVKSLDSSNYDTLRSHVLTIVEEMRILKGERYVPEDDLQGWADRLEAATRGDRQTAK